jgi:pimeloyl-ACP methyl ester carboxylesterase
MGGLLICLISILAVAFGNAQEVVQVLWPTRLAAVPPSFPSQVTPWLPTLRAALGSLPEETIVLAGLSQGSLLGLAPAEVQKLQALFATNYARLRLDAAFKSAPSALPYCLAERRPTNGLATVYVPAKVAGNPRTVVFLHGYGGSLLVFIHALAETFPDDLIVCPAYGLSCAGISSQYVSEALKATGNICPAATNSPPLLIGLSAGGVGGWQLYDRKPAAFRRFISIVSIPPAEVLARPAARSDIRCLAGGNEWYVAGGSFQRQMTALKPRLQTLEWKIIEGADHFLILSHRDEVQELLRAWTH